MPPSRANASVIDPLPLVPPNPEDELSPALQEALTTAVPPEALSALLTRHSEAYNPKEPKIVATNAHSFSVYYLQPVREYWYLPLKQTVTIRIAPPLPVLPADPSVAQQAAWVVEISERLQKYAESTEPPVARYIGPCNWADWAGITVFMSFTLVIVAYILGLQLLQTYVFTTEKRFNITVAVHCGILIKRSTDVRELAILLHKHWKGGRKDRMLWFISGWVEGWRAVKRLRDEAGRVALEMSSEVDERKGKGESKKKR